MQQTVTTTHLQMLHPSWLNAKPRPRDDLVVNRVSTPLPELNRFFYTAVGGDWYWCDRLAWTYPEWLTYLDRPQLQTWIIAMAGTPMGYFELEQQAEGDVEIVYFGLLPAFAELKLGGWALSEAVRRAWAMDGKRVWLHTCNLDHPRALANYLARGFRIFKTETKIEELPERPIGPWLGHDRGTEPEA